MEETDKTTEEFKIKNGVLEKYSGAGGSIRLPAGITAVKLNAYQSAKSDITEIIFDESITEIPENACRYLASLRSVVIPQSVTRIGRNAFSGCTSLVEICLPESLLEIGNGAFCGCASLKIHGAYAPRRCGNDRGSRIFRL